HLRDALAGIELLAGGMARRPQLGVGRDVAVHAHLRDRRGLVEEIPQAEARALGLLVEARILMRLEVAGGRSVTGLARYALASRAADDGRVTGDAGAVRRRRARQADRGSVFPRVGCAELLRAALVEGSRGDPGLLRHRMALEAAIGPFDLGPERSSGK